MKWLSTFLLAFAISSGFHSTAAAQEGAGAALPKLVQANERFGRRLLLEVHKPAPDRNVVVSPLPVTLMMAAVQSSSTGGALREQGNSLFGWGLYPQLLIPSRMLLTAFDKPVPIQVRPILPKEPKTYLPEGAWITNTLLYRSIRGADPVNEDFRREARKYFQVELINSGLLKPRASNGVGSHKDLPKIPANTDALIVSGIHLRTKWRGNTFSMSTPAPGVFHSPEGEKVVSMLTSELHGYLYMEGEDYEAVALPADEAYMLAVLPKSNASLSDVEKELVEHPESLDVAMKKQLGKVTMPVFHIGRELDLRPPLEGLGVKAIFQDLPGIFTVPKTRIESFRQKIDMEVDENGIRADAETVAGVVYGGIVVGKEPFHLVLDRPFLFLIRDQNTNSLMFIGAVVDPTEN